YRVLFTEPTYRIIALRTLGISAAVAVTDIALAFPIAYYAARVAAPRVRAAILLAIVLPLWSSYLVRVFAWRTILQGGGPAQWLLRQVGLGGVRVTFSNWAVWIAFTYLWLPYVDLPFAAAYAMVPVAIMAIYLFLARRLGAFEAL